MLAAVTLLPALLGFVGRPDRPAAHPRAAAGRRRHRHRAGRPLEPGRAAPAVDRARPPACSILGVLALPFLGVRYGFPDAGNDRAGTTTRQAYELLADGFGPGANGPLLLVADGGPAVLAGLRDRIAATPGVAAVLPPQSSPAGDAAVMTVLPTTSPQSEETEQLVAHAARRGGRDRRARRRGHRGRRSTQPTTPRPGCRC